MQDRDIKRFISAIFWMFLTFWMPKEGQNQIEKEAGIE